MIQKVAKFLLLPVAVVAVLALWSTWAFLQPILSLNGYCWTFAELGTWGDSFGALTSLFTSLGFIAVGATFWLQRRQISSSERYQHLERFENLYFEIVKLLREVRKDIRYQHSIEYQNETGTFKREMHTDDAAFRYAWREIKHYIDLHAETPSVDQAVEVYMKTVHRRFESGFAPYFRLIYTLLRRISTDSILKDEEKKFYANLVRTQLSSYELAVIGINALSPVSGNLSDYLIEFRMLKYLPSGHSRRRILLPYYPEEAFSGRND